MSKFEVTGKAVLYTRAGVKVVDAQVRRYFNSNCDSNNFKVKQTGDYMLIGGARTVPTDNPYAKPAYHPLTVEHAARYASTKFFRLTLDLMRLAQWEPIHKYNVPMNQHWFTHNQFTDFSRPDVDFAKPLDEQLYRKYDFNPSMIHFTEERYP